MTQQEKNVICDMLFDSVDCATNTVYESLALLFDTMAKHPEFTLQEVLIGMSMGLRMLIDKKEN